MAVVTMRQLLESGVHFGHQTRRWNPKMKRFIMTERNGIYIIDLQQSLTYINNAYEFVKETVAHGGTILFVGTKKQAQEPIAEQATRVGMPYVNHRWLGGMLTNFQTISKRLTRLKELEELDFDDVAGSGCTKKELLILKREKIKLEKTLGGIRTMAARPLGRLDRRHEEGAPRRRRGPQARPAGHRDPRHQLRPRRGRLQDPGQRRRDPLGHPADPGHRRRRRRGPRRPRRWPAPPVTSVAAEEPLAEWERELYARRRRRRRGDRAEAARRRGRGRRGRCRGAGRGPPSRRRPPEAAPTEVAEPMPRPPRPRRRGQPAEAPTPRPTGRRAGLTGPSPPDHLLEPHLTPTKRAIQSMANYTAADIKALREQTGAGMMDVKKALDEADGDRAKAAEILRVKGLKGVTKREGRTASNGLVAAKAGDGVGTLVEVLCETDFVAKGEKFIALADQVLDQAVAAKARRRRRAAREHARRRQDRPGAARRGQRHHRREDRGQARGPPRGRARRVLPAQDQPRPARADRCPRGHRRVATSQSAATSRCTSRRSARPC